MSDRKTLIVHIGTHKTGTTFFQNSLARNRDLLLKQGILYPKSGEIHNAHFKLSWQLNDPANRAKPIDEVGDWPLLIKELQESPAHTALISSEEFSLTGQPQRFDLLKKYFDVRIFCMIRSPDAFLQSFYSQWVKDFHSRETRPLSRYLAEENPFFLDNRRLLEKWLKVFGRPAMIVGNFDKAASQGNLLAGMFSCLDWEVPKGMAKPTEDILHKVSLPPDALEYLRLSNPHLKVEKGHHKFVVDLVRAAQEHKAELQTTSAGILSLRARKMLRDRFAPQNVWLAKTFWDSDKNPFPASAAPLPPEGFRQRPEEADGRVMGKVAATLQRLLK